MEISEEKKRLILEILNRLSDNIDAMQSKVNEIQKKQVKILSA